MAAAPTRISELTQVTPVGTDQIPIARGFGAGGQTLKITVDSLNKKNSTDIDELSGRTISVVDSPTIDLTYNSSTRQLSADLQMNLDLRSRTILLPSFIEIPPGCIMPFAGTAAPDGWVICNGDIVPNGVGPVQGKNYNFSRLWTVLGTTYGATPGTLPDLRGYFIRGYGGTVNPNVGNNADGTFSGAFGQKVADTFQGHKHGIYDPQHRHQIIDPGHEHPIQASGSFSVQATPGPGAPIGRTLPGGGFEGAEVVTDVTGGGSGPVNVTKQVGTIITDYLSFNGVSIGNAVVESTVVNVSMAASTAAAFNSNTAVRGITATELSVTNVLVQNPTIDSADTGSIAGPSASRAPSTSFETKPSNMALLYCIKV